VSTAIRERLSRPCLIVTVAGDDILATAQRTDTLRDLWLITLAGGEQIRVVGEDSMNTLLDTLSRSVAARGSGSTTKYDREDPETAEPLPEGVAGFAVGRGPARRAALLSDHQGA